MSRLVVLLMFALLMMLLLFVLLYIIILLFQPRMCRRRTGRQRDVWARREDTSTPSHGRFMVKVLTGGFAGSAVASAATR